MDYTHETWGDEIPQTPADILHTEGSTTVFTPSLQMILSGRIWMPTDVLERD